MSVKAALTPDRRQQRDRCIDCGGQKSGKYRCRECYEKPRVSSRTMDEMVAGVIRMIDRGLGRQVAEGDPEDLEMLLQVGEAYERALRKGVDGLRASGYSDAWIGQALGGVTRQAVGQRFPRSAP